jgi:hypothetical protein
MLRFDYMPLDLMIDEGELVDGLVLSTIRISQFFETRGVLSEVLTPTPRKRNFPSDYPLEWTDAQRRAYFAKVRAGKTTYPYRRTGTLSSGWRSDVKPTNDGAVLTLRNDTDYAKWVIGSFSQTKPQQYFHSVTGWRPLVEQFDNLADRLEVSIQEDLQRTLGSEVITIR